MEPSLFRIEMHRYLTAYWRSATMQAIRHNNRNIAWTHLEDPLTEPANIYQHRRITNDTNKRSRPCTRPVEEGTLTQYVVGASSEFQRRQALRL